MQFVVFGVWSMILSLRCYSSAPLVQRRNSDNSIRLGVNHEWIKQLIMRCRFARRRWNYKPVM